MRLCKDKVLRNDPCNLLILWSAKAGCSTALQMFFKYINYQYDNNKFIHMSRIQYENTVQPNIFPNNYNNYITLQVVRNPYIRAVSSYLVSTIREESYYKDASSENYQLINISNNLRFIEFLELLYYHIESKSNIDIHYDIQSMTHSYIPIRLNNIIKLENFEQDIKNINQKYNLKLDPYIKYDSHAHNSLTSDYVFYHKTQPKEYYLYYKDKKTKNLVKKIYSQDIENFKYLYPY